MPCDTRPTLTAADIAAQAAAVRRLEERIAAGLVSVVVGAQGSVAFKGWQAEERGGLSDLCAYRKLAGTNSPALRRAVARAEALAGRKVDAHAIAHGHHSHDGGQTWSKH